jgi:hypothetical protein
MMMMIDGFEGCIGAFLEASSGNGEYFVLSCGVLARGSEFFLLDIDCPDNP